MRRFFVGLLPFFLLALVASSCAQSEDQTSDPTSVSTPVPSSKSEPDVAVEYQLPGDYLTALLVNDVERWFLVHLPPTYQPGVPMPLVVNLHGRSSTAYQQEAISKMNKKADEEGFIVVNPQAEGDTATWWGPIPGTQGQPDRDFFEMLLLHLQSELSVDPIRIYATGLSNGASMANRLGCDMSETFAAIAPVAGGHVAFDQCTVASPVAVVVFHSTGDHIIPYEGNGSDIPAVRTWVEAWAQRNGCRAPDQSERPYPDVMLESWDDCSENAEVWFFTIEEGGHSWPGLEFGTFEEGYPVKVGATDVIWDFFKTHPKE